MDTPGEPRDDETSTEVWAMGLIPVPEEGILTPAAALAFLETDAAVYARMLGIAMTTVESSADRAAYGMLALDLAARVAASAVALRARDAVSLDRSALGDVGEPIGLCVQLARICATRPAESDDVVDAIYAACARQIVALLSATTETSDKP